MDHIHATEHRVTQSQRDLSQIADLTHDSESNSYTVQQLYRWWYHALRGIGPTSWCVPKHKEECPTARVGFRAQELTPKRPDEPSDALWDAREAAVRKA